MTDSPQLDFDMREFCAQVLREYDEVIATIIRRPISIAAMKTGAIVDAALADAPLGGAHGAIASGGTATAELR